MQTGASQSGVRRQSETKNIDKNIVNNNTTAGSSHSPLNMSDSEDEELDKEAVGRAVNINTFKSKPLFVHLVPHLPKIVAICHCHVI